MPHFSYIELEKVYLCLTPRAQRMTAYMLSYVKFFCLIFMEFKRGGGGPRSAEGAGYAPKRRPDASTQLPKWEIDASASLSTGDGRSASVACAE